MGGISGTATVTYEQVTETHRTLNADHTITEDELPGLVNVYLNIGGGRILIDQLNAGKVLDAIELAKANQPPVETDTAPPSEQV